VPLSENAIAWRDACRRAVARQRELLRAGGPWAEPTSIGASGDITLAIDHEFEAIALEEIDPLVNARGATMHVVSEERGEGGAASVSAGTWVVLDPIDGSTNVANGLPQFSLSVAVASGPTMADVWFGYVFDFGTSEEFACEKASGLTLNGEPVDGFVPGPACLVGVESAEPRLLAAGLERVADAGVKEIRVVGSIAIALCYVALGRLDGLLTCKECRSVDAAAGQLIASSTGAAILFDGAPPQTAGLELAERYRLVAGRDGLVDELADAQRLVPLVPR
jgi:myo-inositol-1(or 4)-monophosphatase